MAIKEVNSMATIFDVAEYILGKFPYGISTMKLQKLAFFAQGWTLAFLDRPLFDEEFEAWTRGPVSRPLYDEHQGKYSVHEGSFPQGVPHRLTPEERACIDAVIQNYGALSGPQLSELTHKAGTPWSSIRDDANLTNGARSNIVICKNTVKEYFKTTLEV